MSSDDGQTYTYRLTLDTTLLDPDRYGAVLDILMDAVSKASEEISGEHISCRLVLTDTSTLDNTVLDLDGLARRRVWIVDQSGATYAFWRKADAQAFYESELAGAREDDALELEMFSVDAPAALRDLEGIAEGWLNGTLTANS